MHLHARLLAFSCLVPLVAAALGAMEPLPAPAGEPMLPAAEAATLDGGRAMVSLVRRPGLGLVRVEDAAQGNVMRRREMVGDRLLVRLAGGADAAAVARAAGGQLGGRAGRDGPWLLTLPVRAHGDLPAAIRRLAADPRIAAVEPDWIVHAIGTPNDASFGQLWGMHNTGQSGGTADADIDAPEAWDITTGSTAVLVGVIDTGIDRNHPDLAANMWVNPGESGLDGSGADKRTNGVDDDGNGYIDDWRGWDFVNNDNDPADDVGHGTHVAGTIGAVGDNGIGVAGVAWRVSMVGLKFLGTYGGTTSGAIAAIDYARTIGCDLTSNSWGGGAYSQQLSDAIAAAGAAGQLFVAAAGNNGTNNDLTPVYPASYPLDCILTVAATTRNDLLSGFSCYGATSVDIAAPGSAIYSTLPNGTYGSYDGTSMATPHVSGACALLRSINPTITATEMKQVLMANADPLAALAGKVVSGGRLNVHAAVLAIAGTQLAAQSLVVVEQGDGDGVFEPGEGATITLNLRNVGTDPATAVEGLLTVDSGEAVPVATTATWPDLAPGDSAPGSAAFILAFPPNAATPQQITASITVSAAAGGPWTFPVVIDLRRGALLAGSVRRVGSLLPISGATVTCSGPEGGSTTTAADGSWQVQVTDGSYAISVSASGLTQLVPVQVTAPPDHPNLEILVGQALVAVDPAILSVTIDQDASATRTLTISNPGDAPLTAQITAHSATWTATGLWHEATWRSPAGDTAWYYGRDDTRTYNTGTPNSGTLTSPSVSIPLDAQTLSFREWRSAETFSSYDITRLEVTTNAGATWTTLHTTLSNASSWRTVSVPIASLAGTTARFRFLFDTIDAFANDYEGWYIDDVQVDGRALGGWLSATPTTVAVAAAESATVQVAIDGQGLPPGSYTGEVRLTSNAGNAAVLNVPVLLTIVGAPVLTAGSVTIDDSAVAPAQGDGDGFAEAGERLRLIVPLQNMGSVAAAGISATLTSNHTALTVVSGTTVYPDIATGATAVPLLPLTVSIAPDCPVGTVLAMDLVVGDSDSHWWTVPVTITTTWRGRLEGSATLVASSSPAVGAVISIAGLTATTAADGSFSITGVPAGTYQATASLAGQATTRATLTFPPDQVWNPTFGTRDLTIAPASLNISSTRYGETDGELQLASTGALPVNWSATTASSSYTWIDSDQPGGPLYDWQDISATGTLISSSGDDVNYGPLPIGFAFPYYGSTFSTFRVCSNGWISFTSISSTYSSYALPSLYAPENLIAALWADLYITTGSQVRYQMPDPDRLIVQFTDVAYFSDTSKRFTFQTILHRDGTILLQYQRVDQPSLATVGIQDATRTRGLTVTRNTNLLHAEFAVRISAHADWLSLPVSSGTIAAGSSQQVLVHAAPAGRPSGVYNGSIVFTSDDNDTPSITVPVTLTVGNPSAPVASSADLAAVRNTALAVTLHGSDADGDPLTYAVSLFPLHGSLSGTPPTLIYLPAPGYLGPDAFAFTASDGERQSAPALVVIDVQPSDLGPPVALPCSLITNEDQTGSADLAAHDPDGDPIGWSIQTQPAHGTASLLGNRLSFTPHPDWNGSDTVVVVPFDTKRQGAAMTVALTVTPTADAPFIADASGTLVSGRQLALNPPCGDADGDAFSLSLVTPPARGTATVSGTTVTYDSPAGWIGDATCTVRAMDATGLLSSEATITFHVVATSSGPVSPQGGGGGGGGCGVGAIALAVLGLLGLHRRRRPGR